MYAFLTFNQQSEYCGIPSDIIGSSTLVPPRVFELYPTDHISIPGNSSVVKIDTQGMLSKSDIRRVDPCNIGNHGNPAGLAAKSNSISGVD